MLSVDDLTLVMTSLKLSVDSNQFEDLSTGYSSVLCGTHGLFAWTSEGNEVVVTLVTDDEGSSSGLAMVHSWVDVSQGKCLW